MKDDTDRARWSFGRLLEWHLGVHGTRPGGSPDRPGRIWGQKEFAGAVGASDRTVRNWMGDKNPPLDLGTIENTLFGRQDFTRYAAWRLELREAYARLVDPQAKSVAAEHGGSLPPLDEPAPAERPMPLSNIPIPVPAHFMGRDDALATVDAAFAGADGRLAVAITALHGLRGVGKSTLAAAYAERHRRNGGRAWWIRAHEETSLRASLVGLGITLGWVQKNDEEEPALQAVKQQLRHDGAGLLLIYDNAISADAVRPWLPPGGKAHVIVTSNSHDWRGVATPVQIDVWPVSTGADFLLARTGRSEKEHADAEALSQALGGLPLAHEQAGAWCAGLEKPLAAYLERFEAAPARIIADDRHAPMDYGRTVAKTFALAIDEAAKLHPAAEPLILHAALLAPHPIPLFLFAEAHDAFDEPLRSALADDGFDEAVAALRAFALVERETIVDERDASVTFDAICLHRLVREVAALRAGEQAESMRQTLAAALEVVYPDEGRNNPASWPRSASLTPHLVSLCQTEMGDDAADTRRAVLLNRAGGYFAGRATYVEALPLLKRALAIRERVLGPDHAETAINLNNLAVVLCDQGDLAGAQPLHERALAIREKALGPHHPDIAVSLNNLAALLHARGDLAGARFLLERALTIDEKSLGPHHPDMALRLNNLAALLQAQGDLAGARPIYERALAIREKVFGPDHPDTATTLHDLAALLYTRGDLAGARSLFERALVIREKALGPHHPDTALRLNNLAVLLQAQGDLAGARPLYDRALAIREKALGPDHPDTATTLNGLATLLHDQGDFAGALPFHERALAIREKALGPDHRNTATSLNNLAIVLSKTGDTDDAEALFKRAIAIGEKTLGGEHSLTQRFCSRYARHMLDTGRAAAALPLAQAALAAHEGASHLYTKDSARVAADALDALGRGEEAAALRTRHGING